MADGKNPLDRVDIYYSYGVDTGTILAACDCGTLIKPGDDLGFNLQDLVLTVSDHAKTCPLHLANLPKERKK